MTRCDRSPNPLCSCWKCKQMGKVEPTPWLKQQALIKYLLCTRTGLSTFKQIVKPSNSLPSHSKWRTKSFRDLEGSPGSFLHLTSFQLQWYPFYLKPFACFLLGISAHTVSCAWKALTPDICIGLSLPSFWFLPKENLTEVFSGHIFKVVALLCTS